MAVSWQRMARAIGIVREPSRGIGGGRWHSMLPNVSPLKANAILDTSPFA
jgi:hypothetical protein